MPDEENLDAEMRELFGITDEPESGTPEESTQSAEPETDAPEEQPATQQEPESKSADNTDAAEPETNPAKETNANPEDTTKDAPLNPEEKFTKQNSAFAQMRIQNKELTNLLMDLARATGQNPKNITEAQDLLKEGLNKVVSKNRNIPEDVLREMEEDKKKLAELTQNQARQKAIAGFQQVRDMYQLTKEDVNNFTDKLIERNINPFEHEVDLLKEYRNIYFDELIAKARDAGVQEERARSLKAQNSSTTPSTQRGLPENAGNQKTQIKTVADLNDFLDSLNDNK